MIDKKYTIERHSSTATRLSQRLVVSLGQCNNVMDTDVDEHVSDYDLEADTESFDITGAFLQG